MINQRNVLNTHGINIMTYWTVSWLLRTRGPRKNHSWWLMVISKNITISRWIAGRLPWTRVLTQNHGWWLVVINGIFTTLWWVAGRSPWTRGLTQNHRRRRVVWQQNFGRNVNILQTEIDENIFLPTSLANVWTADAPADRLGLVVSGAIDGTDSWSGNKTVSGIWVSCTEKSIRDKFLSIMFARWACTPPNYEVQQHIFPLLQIVLRHVCRVLESLYCPWIFRPLLQIHVCLVLYLPKVFILRPKMKSRDMATKLLDLSQCFVMIGNPLGIIFQISCTWHRSNLKSFLLLRWSTRGASRDALLCGTWPVVRQFWILSTRGLFDNWLSELLVILLIARTRGLARYRWCRHVVSWRRFISTIFFFQSFFFFRSGSLSRVLSFFLYSVRRGRSPRRSAIGTLLSPTALSFDCSITFSRSCRKTILWML